MDAIKKSKVFLGIFIPILAFFLMSQNTFAASIATSKFDLYYTPSAALTPYQWRRDLLYSSTPTIIDADGGVRQYQFYTPNTTAGGNFVTLHFETNIVATRYDTNSNFNPWVNLAQQNIINCASGSASIVSRNISFATTYWHNSDGDNNTLTVYGDVVMRGFTQNQSYGFICQIGSSGYSFIDPSSSVAVWFEQNPVIVNWFNDESLALQQTQVNQNNTMIYNQEVMIEDSQEYYDKQYNAIDNIGDQSSSDIEGATNQQTTNLIGVITDFVTVLQGRGTVSNDCNLNLPFPSFLGGNITVNICSGKNNLRYDGVNYITIFSRLFLICFFVPLIWILLKMIYNEIRSWTNG